MITDLGHIALATHDLEQSLAFYARLGIHEAFRLNHPDGRIMLIYLHVAGDRFIELFPGGPPPDPERQGTFKHLCLLTDSLHHTVEQLRQDGVVIEKEPTLGLDHNWQAWIRDPDGNAIELMQLVEESPQRKTARGGF
jgi:lactoylglutathione lyase